jgi:hypothetical protein
MGRRRTRRGCDPSAHPLPARRDDPTTDVDNDHAIAICATGVVPVVVGLLRSSGEDHARAAAVAAALVENAQCAKMFLGAGAVGALLALSQHGSDRARRSALTALRMLALGHDGRERIAAADGRRVLDGLARRGTSDVRRAAAEFTEVLDAKTIAAAVSARGHAQRARSTRVAQSKIWNGNAPAAS